MTLFYFCSVSDTEIPLIVIIIMDSMDTSGDVEEIDQIICVCGHLIQVYLEKYVLKIPCMTSNQTGYMHMVDENVKCQ